MNNADDKNGTELDEKGKGTPRGVSRFEESATGKAVTVQIGKAKLEERRIKDNLTSKDNA